MEKFERKKLSKEEIQKVEGEIEWNQIVRKLCKAQALEAKTKTEHDYLILCSSMALHRIMQMRVKLLHNCGCGRSHDGQLQMYRDQLDSLEKFMFETFL